MGIESIGPIRVQAAVQGLNPRKYSSNASDINNITDTVNFSGTENESEQLVNNEKKSPVKNKGLLFAIGTAVVAVGIWFLTRGKGGKSVSKATSDVASSVTEGSGKAGEKASEAVSETVKETVSKPNSVNSSSRSRNKNSKPATKAEPETSSSSSEVSATPKNKTEEPAPVKKDTQPVEKPVSSNNTGVAPNNKPNEETLKPKNDTNELKPETKETTEVVETGKKKNKRNKASTNVPVKAENPLPAVVVATAADDIAKSGGKLVEDIQPSVSKAKASAPGSKPAEDILNPSMEESITKGKYGQDINDPLDPRNADDISSPYYKQKGIYGQDIDDPLDPRNADDISSPYYKQKGVYGQDPYDPLNPLNNDDPLSPYYGTNDPFNTFGF